MKLLCVIDTLGSGGAQKQMVHIACGLQARGHAVEVLVYFPENTFFMAQLRAAKVLVHVLDKPKQGVAAVFVALVRLLREKQFDAALGFLVGPCALLALASVFAPRTMRLVLGERSVHSNTLGRGKINILRSLHVLADDIVANSHTQAQWLGQRWWLKGSKTHAVYNGYALGGPPLLGAAETAGPCRLLILARVDISKNGVRLAQALHLFAQKHGDVPEVRWAGRQEQDAASLRYRADIDAVVANNPVLAARWHWLGERSDVPALLQDCDALLHVSLFEGLPNAVCEALIAGRPVIASAVCDHPKLVSEGARGFLCDPLSPESICAALERFVALDAPSRAAMGAQARAYAEAHLGMDRMVQAYEKILQGQAPPLEGDGPCAA
jgi:glycosyltransferase involved in cell wall biosynthesis